MMFGMWTYRSMLNRAKVMPDHEAQLSAMLRAQQSPIYDPTYDPGKWRSKRIWSSARWFVLYVVFGLWVLYEFGDFPRDLVPGLITDAIFAVAFYKLIRVWDSRRWHADGSDPHLDGPMQKCRHYSGVWRCAGMQGHIGPHLYGISDE